MVEAFRILADLVSTSHPPEREDVSARATRKHLSWGGHWGGSDDVRKTALGETPVPACHLERTTGDGDGLEIALEGRRPRKSKGVARGASRRSLSARLAEHRFAEGGTTA